MNKIATIVVLLTFLSSNCRAQLPSFNSQLGGTASGAEFFVGKVEGKPLIRVNIISGLRLPGVYHIPVDTDLAELISYAGGAVEGADLDEIRVKSEDRQKGSLTVYNFYDLTESKGKMPGLNSGDIIQIDVSKDSLATTAIWVGILSSIATVSLAILTYNKNN